MNMKFVTVLSLVFTVGMSWSHSVPPELFESGSAVLFQGDSITDGMHGGDMNHVYGHGYACEIASRYQAYRPEGRVQFGNRGKSGDTSSNLVERWSTDAFPYVIRENGYGGGARPEERSVRYAGLGFHPCRNQRLFLLDQELAPKGFLRGLREEPA